MNITKIRAIYFSGTGNTGRAVITVAQKMSQLLEIPYEAVSINPSSVRKMDFEFSGEELAIVGSPVYAGRIPNLLLPFYQTKLKGNKTPAIAICTYGNRSVDDALMELRNTLQENNFAVIGAGAIVAQHVFAHRLGQNRPGYGDVKKLNALAKEVVKKVQTLDAVPEEPIHVVGNNPVGPYYTPRDRYGYPINIIKVRPKTDRKKCTNCGVCIKMCPMDAIAPDPNQVPGPCIKCGNCFKVCPSKAKYYDDENFLFHQKELNAQFVEPKQSEIFF